MASDEGPTTATDTAPAGAARQAAEEVLSAIGGRAADAALDVAEGALALAMFDHPDADLATYRAHLAEMTRAVADAAGPAGEPPVALAAAIVGQFGYRGDRNSYEDMQNADMVRVIDRRRGLPVALSILYLHAARAQGWTAVGLNFPYHFLIRVEHAGHRSILDPFHDGVSLDAIGLRRLLKQLAGPAAELERRYFDAAADREVLLRLQNNIKSRAMRERDFPRAAEVVRRMLLFAPDHAPLWREASLIAYQSSEVQRAVRLAEEYFVRAPDAATRNDAARLLQKLQRNLN